MNCAAVTDAQTRMSNFSITFIKGASSHSCFWASTLYDWLENNLLQDGFVLFGEDECINPPFSPTPFPNVMFGSNDDCNFYRSQVSIQIISNSITFHRSWQLFWCKFPYTCALNMQLKFLFRDGEFCDNHVYVIFLSEITALVSAHAKLHDYCINCSESVPFKQQI